MNLSIEDLVQWYEITEKGRARPTGGVLDRMGFNDENHFQRFLEALPRGAYKDEMVDVDTLRRLVAQLQEIGDFLSGFRRGREVGEDLKNAIDRAAHLAR